MAERNTLDRDTEPDIEVLRRRERARLSNLAIYRPDPRLNGIAGREVILVGAGAVNLIVALLLVREGARVRIVEARPDPRTTTEWARLGCTFGGHDSRIFSLTEARQHHRRDRLATDGSAYRRSFDMQGWLCCAPESLDALARAWVDRHEEIPGWLLQHYGEDILRFNFESLAIWRNLQVRYPALFSPPVFRDGLIRTYPSRESMVRGRETEESAGSSAREVPLDELSRGLPALAEAVAKGDICGALSVAGFSVNIHSFGRRLINLLEESGVDFTWGKSVSAILRAPSGPVRGIRIDAEEITADDYVVSPGAYGASLLEGFVSYGSVAGVIGAWIAIPNAEPQLHMPLKISRRGFGAPGAAEGANVVPSVDASGREVLAISSGHGFIGILPTDIDWALLDELTRAPRETAKRYFPDKYEAAQSAGLDFDERYCIRPWTPTGLGLLETAPTASGGALVIATGHNTGGFAQSPAIGLAVISALCGQEHPMHQLYHPARWQSFRANLG